jgi:ADP-heptose:LPS heptosyltransferase
MTIDRLLIMRGGAVGDFIVTLPVIGALRQTFPQAWIEVLGHPGRIILADHPRYADRVTDLESLDIYRLFQPVATVSSRLEAYLQSFDLIVAYSPTPDGVFNRQLSQYCHGRVITWPPHPPAGIHVTDYLLQALEPLPLHHIDASPRLEHNAEAEATAEAFWQASGRPPSSRGMVAFHPGSGSQQKLWPLEGWRAVMSWARQHGMDGVVIQGPVEQDRDIEAKLRPATGDWPWTRDLSLHALAALLRRCHVVLSHDSGIAHLAAAAGSATLALFGPTDPYVWGPRSPRACVLQPSLPQPLTLHNLPPEAVIRTLAAMLDGTLVWQPTSVPCTIERLGSP